MTYSAVMVGCGAMAKGWLKAIAGTPELAGAIEIAGLVDLDIDAAESLRADCALPGAKLGTDLDEMLGEVKPDLLFDVVVPGARRRVVSSGLAHGCHVLSEKPMATSLADASAMIEAARSADRIHAIVQNRRFISGVRRIERFLSEGGIGTLSGVHCDFFLGPHFGGFREEMDHPLLLDMAIHTFDAARFMAGKAPQSVYCQEANPAGSWFGHNAAANAVFELSDGVVFTYRGSWAAEGANTSWEGNWRFVGSQGTLLWDGGDRFEARRVAGDTGFMRELEEIAVPDTPSTAGTAGHASVMAEFLDAIATGRKPETDGTDNIESLAMVLGAIESARSGRRVELIT